jgi:hypothetical protein
MKLLDGWQRLPVWETSSYELVTWSRLESGTIVCHHRLPLGFELLVAKTIGWNYFDSHGRGWW